MLYPKPDDHDTLVRDFLQMDPSDELGIGTTDERILWIGNKVIKGLSLDNLNLFKEALDRHPTIVLDFLDCTKAHDVLFTWVDDSQICLATTQDVPQELAELKAMYFLKNCVGPVPRTGPVCTVL
jgi:hypothetical protein